MTWRSNRRVRRQAEEAATVQEAWQGDGHVFTNELRHPLDPAYVTRLFQHIRQQGSRFRS
jgi:hypothetical protein